MTMFLFIIFYVDTHRDKFSELIVRFIFSSKSTLYILLHILYSYSCKILTYFWIIRLSDFFYYRQLTTYYLLHYCSESFVMNQLSLVIEFDFDFNKNDSFDK